MSSGGCGCSQPAMEVSPEKVKEVLEQQSGDYEPAQRRRRPPIIIIPRLPIPWWPPGGGGGGGGQPPCFLPGCRPDPGNPFRKIRCNTFNALCVVTWFKDIQEREKFIFHCNGFDLVHCTAWRHTGECCHPASDAPCNAGGGVQILCEMNGVPSAP